MSYVSTVLADLPLAYYRLDDISTQLVDSSGNSENGTYGGTYSQLVSGCLEYDSDAAASFTTGYADVPKATWMDVANLTAECWVRTTDKGNSAGSVIFSRASMSSGGGATNRSWWLSIGPSDHNLWLGMTFTDSTYINESTGVSVSDGQNHHVVLTWDGTVATVYVDGAQVHQNSANSGKTLRTNTVDILIGWDAAKTYGTTYYNGVVDEAAIYSTALSATRVQAHYTAGITSPFTDNFADAGVLNAGLTLDGIDTTTWTTESGEPGSMSHTGWATFTPTVTTLYSLNTGGSDFDTSIAIYTGSAITSLTQVAANSGTGSAGSAAIVDISLAANTEYYIQVGAQTGGSGGLLSFGLIQDATAALSFAAIEALAVPAAVPVALSQSYMEATTDPTVINRTISLTYLEVLTAAPSQFIGWGMPV